MWVLKTKMDYKGSPLGKIAVQFGVDITGYPLSYYKDKQGLHMIGAGFFLGNEQIKKKVIRYLKKSNELLHVESRGNFIIGDFLQPLSMEPIYDPRIIRTNPSLLSKDGYVIWELASWEKPVIMRVYNIVKKKQNAKILSLKKTRVNNIRVAGVLPKITDKQKRALGLAIAEGYYDYPKKTGLVALSKKMGLSYSTFQAHLKKAEGKLLVSAYKTL